MTTDNFSLYLQNRLIQTSQTGGKWYTDTSPFSIPWFEDTFTSAHHFKEHVNAGVGDGDSRVRRHFVEPVDDRRQRQSRLERLNDDVGVAKLQDRDGKDDARIPGEVFAKLEQILI